MLFKLYSNNNMEIPYIKANTHKTSPHFRKGIGQPPTVLHCLPLPSTLGTTNLIILYLENFVNS